MDHIFFKSLPQKDLFFGTILDNLGVKYDINKSHVLPKGEGDFAKRSLLLTMDQQGLETITLDHEIYEWPPIFNI